MQSKQDDNGEGGTTMAGTILTGAIVLKGSARCRAHASTPRRSGPPRRPPTRDHAGADRGGEEGRQGRLVHLDRPRRRPSGSPRRSRRSSPASRCGSSASAPSACSSASARSTRAASTRSTWSTRRTPPMSSSGSATAGSRRIVPEDVAKHFPAEHKDPDGTFASCPRHALPDRLQHQSGEGRGGAEELRRPARSEMDRQDRQGASRPTAAPS